MRHDSRLGSLALAATTIVAGLLVHRGVVPLSPDARDVAGDALWAAMIFWGTGVVAPRAPVAARAAAAIATCTAVELGQLVRTPALDALRATTIGHLVLGSSFDARDLLAYAFGVVLAAAGASALATRAPASAAGDAAER